MVNFVTFEGIMKKILTTCCVAALSLMSVSASANVVTTLKLDFVSGASYNGTVTFADNYLGMLSTDGTLSGGSYGSVHYSQTWWNSTSQTNPQSYDSNPATYEDWLVGDNSDYIGLSWLYGQLGDAPVLTFINVDSYHSSVLSTDDRIVAGGFGNSVPEPSSIALFGLALGLAAVVARRNA